MSRWSSSWVTTAAVVVFFIGILLMTSAFRHYRALQNDLRRANQVMVESRQKLNRSEEDQRQINDKLVRYNQLVQRGIIGAEQRLAFVEQIRRLGQQLGLQSVAAQFSPRAPLALPGVSASAGKHQLFASAMTLDMSLVTELDLLRYMQGLTDQAPALIYPKTCRVEREAAGSGNLKAVCNLLWITVE